MFSNLGRKTLKKRGELEHEQEPDVDKIQKAMATKGIGTVPELLSPNCSILATVAKNSTRTKGKNPIPWRQIEEIYKAALRNPATYIYKRLSLGESADFEWSELVGFNSRYIFSLQRVLTQQELKSRHTRVLPKPMFPSR